VKRQYMRMRWTFFVIASVAFAAGCSSTKFVVAPQLPKQYETIGVVRGSACGVLLFDVIPIKTNDRTERAYRNALARNRGELLADTHIRERWYFIYAGELLCTDIEATAVR
jgi:hypothetical protein